MATFVSFFKMMARLKLLISLALKSLVKSEERVKTEPVKTWCNQHRKPLLYVNRRCAIDFPHLSHPKVFRLKSSLKIAS